MRKQPKQSLTLFEERPVLERDKDAELKLRSARMFWHMGYVCPMEVAISAREIRQGVLRRYDLTDVDVVGVRFDADMTSRTIIADCKSTKASPNSRVFWLRGVMDFFGAERGYLVQPAIGREARELALRLSVSLVDLDNLIKYEADKQLDKLPLKAFSIENYDKRRELWGLHLAKDQKPSPEQKKIADLYAYCSYTYWFNEDYRNVQQLLSAVSDASQSLNEFDDRPRAKVLAYTSLTLWSIALLKMCGAVIATKSDEVHNEVRRYIFGGAANASERSKLMDLFGRLTKDRVALEPPYYDELLELCARIIKFSSFGKDIPRYTDLITQENVIGGSHASIESLLGSAFSVDSLKLAKDVAAFISRHAHVDIKLFSELMSQ